MLRKLERKRKIGFEVVEKNFEKISEKYTQLEKTLQDLKEYVNANSIKVPSIN